MSIDYKERMRELRGHVNFNYDLRKKLSSGQKAKINKYYEEYKSFSGGLYRRYNSRDKKKLAKIQKATGMNLRGFTHAFIPNYHDNLKYTPKIDKDGTVSFVTKFEDKIIYQIDAVKFAKNPERELDRVLKSVKEKRIGVLCGAHEFKQPRLQNKEDTRQLVNYLVNTYNSFNADGTLANNNYRNWLHGFFGVRVKNQKEYEMAMRNKTRFSSLTRKKKLEVLKLEHKKQGKKNGKKKSSRRRL